MDHDHYPDAYLQGILESVRTIALVGASDRDTRPSYFVLKYLLGKGYRVIPINPSLAGGSILGQPVYADLADLAAAGVAVDMVDIFRNAAAAGPVTDAAIALPARVVWMQLGVRNDQAAARAEAAGLQVVMNRCPKIEYSRLFGEIGRLGVNSGVLSSRRRVVKPAKKLM